MKTTLINTWKHLVEQRVFGVCSYFGEWMGISDSRLRVYFIYASFLALGSPVLIYLALAFWMEMRKVFVYHRKSVWDL